MDQDYDWNALAAVATFGMFIVAVISLCRPPRGTKLAHCPPRLNVAGTNPAGGLYIRSYKTGRWNQARTDDCGDAILDPEYEDQVTEVAIYAIDKITVLGRQTLDYSKNKKFLSIDLRQSTRGGRQLKRAFGV